MRMLMLPAHVTLHDRRPSLVSWREPAPDPPAGGAAPPRNPPPRRPETAGRLQRHPVARVLDRWRYDGRWWEREIHRDYFLVELRGGGIVELFREEDAWWLARASD